MMRRDSEDSAPEQAAGLHSGSSPTLAARLYVEPHKLDPPTYIHIYILYLYTCIYIGYRDGGYIGFWGPRELEPPS